MFDDWLVYAIVLVGAVIGIAILVSPALIIWVIIRWINRRADPRRAKPPPDYP